jgi:hypothetical protein
LGLGKGCVSRLAGAWLRRRGVRRVHAGHAIDWTNAMIIKR